MKVVKLLTTVAVLVVVGFFVWNYLAGPLKERRETRTFGQSLTTCTPYSQRLRKLNRDDHRTHDIDGEVDGTCMVRFATLGPDKIVCAFAPDMLEEIGTAYTASADDIGLFGGTRFQYSSSNPDPLTRALNSGACKD